MNVTNGKDARWLAEQYGSWLSIDFDGLIKVVQISERCFQFQSTLGTIPLIELQFDLSSSDHNRVLFRVTAGMLVDQKSNGKFEFRVSDGQTVLVILHNFTPRLPWWIYRWTQDPFHARRMRRFGEYISKTA